MSSGAPSERGAGRRRAGWRIPLLALALTGGAWPDASALPQGSEGATFRRIELTKVGVSRSGTSPESGQWRLKVEGTCPRVPKGTRVEFQVSLQWNIVETFTETVGGAETFAFEVDTKKLPVTGKKMYLRTQIRAKDQTPEVKEAIRRDAEAFPPKLDTWTDHHFETSFVLGSADEIRTAHDAVCRFFVDQYDSLLAIDARVEEAARKAGEKSAYTKDGAFQAAEWRAFFDREVLLPLKGIQKKVADAASEAGFLHHQNALSYLQEITNGVARRVLEKQRKLYESLAVDLAAADRTPEGLDLTTITKAVPKSAYLNKQWSQIAIALGLPDGEKTEK